MSLKGEVEAGDGQEGGNSGPPPSPRAKTKDVDAGQRPCSKTGCPWSLEKHFIIVNHECTCAEDVTWPLFHYDKSALCDPLLQWPVKENHGRPHAW